MIADFWPKRLVLTCYRLGSSFPNNGYNFIKCEK